MKKITTKIISLIVLSLISMLSYSIHTEYKINDKIVDYLFDLDFEKLEKNLLNLISKDELSNKKIYMKLLVATNEKKDTEKNKIYLDILLDKYKVNFNEISDYMIKKDDIVEKFEILYKQKKITKQDFIDQLIYESNMDKRIDTSIPKMKKIHSKILDLYIDGAELNDLSDFGQLIPKSNEDLIKSYNKIMSSKLNDNKKNEVNIYLFSYFTKEEMNELLNSGFKFRIQTKEFLETYFYEDYMDSEILDYIGLNQIDVGEIYKIEDPNSKTFAFLLKNMIFEAENVNDKNDFARLMVSLYKNNRLDIIKYYEKISNDYSSLNVLNSLFIYLKKTKAPNEILKKIERLVIKNEEKLLLNYYLYNDVTNIKDYLRNGNYSDVFYNVVTNKIGIYLE